jgi:hypothetical protein
MFGMIFRWVDVGLLVGVWSLFAIMIVEEEAWSTF